MSRELGTYLSIVRRLHHDSMVSLVTPLFSAWLPLTTHILAILKKIMRRDVWNLKHRCSTRDEETLFVSSLRWLPQNDQTAALVEVPPLFSDWTDPSMGICPVMSVNRICICIHVIERVPSMGICSPWQLVRRRDGHVANMPRGHCNNVQCAGGLKQGQDFKIKVKITFYTTAWLWVFLCITRLCRL